MADRFAKEPRESDLRILRGMSAKINFGPIERAMRAADWRYGCGAGHVPGRDELRRALDDLCIGVAKDLCAAPTIHACGGFIVTNLGNGKFLIAFAISYEYVL